MADFDRVDIDGFRIVRLKTQRTKLRRSKQLMKERESGMTPVLQQEIEAINREIKHLSEIIFRLSGERE